MQKLQLNRRIIAQVEIKHHYMLLYLYYFLSLRFLFSSLFFLHQQKR